MAKIYQRAEDKNVATNVIYFSIDNATLAGTAYAYGDHKETKKLSADELRNAFNNGCVAVPIERNLSDRLRYYLKLTEITCEDDGSCTVGLITDSTGEIKLIKIHSAEYTGS